MLTSCALSINKSLFSSEYESSWLYSVTVTENQCIDVTVNMIVSICIHVNVLPLLPTTIVTVIATTTTTTTTTTITTTTTTTTTTT